MSKFRPFAFALLVGAAVLATLAAPTVAGAADPDRIAAVGQAAETPIAAPFVGSFEVWCTRGNPAPGTLCQTHHSTPAIDYGMDPGTPINATGDGVVEEIETECVGTSFCRGGAGNFIAILHEDGRFSRYLHLTDVFVEEGETVEVGDVIGTTGITGNTSAPHLHYDEQFPKGTRVYMESLIACVDGEQVLYPDSLGVTEWEDVPFGTVIRNDDYNCLTETSPPPILASGDGVLGITAPVISGVDTFQAEVRVSGDLSIVRVTAHAFTIVDVGSGPVEVRLRRSQLAPFSAPVTYDPSQVPAGPTCAGLHATSDFFGTSGPDVIIGTDGDDVISGGPGADIICGGPGADTINGGRAADTIFGGSGKDKIDGDNGNDVLRAGKGADRVDGGSGSDHINGGNGNDRLRGQRGGDVLVGGGGADTLEGGNGNDTCNVVIADDNPQTGCEQ